MNPTPSGRGLTLNISDTDNRLNSELCLSVAEFFRWELAAAKDVIASARQKLRSWSTLAKDLGIPARERDQVAPAFGLER